MIKASWGSGGRGMRPIEHPDKLIDAVMSARREAKAAFGRDEIYLEKLVRQARQIEVQILGDKSATWSICSNETVQSRGAIRRLSSEPLQRIWTPPSCQPASK